MELYEVNEAVPKLRYRKHWSRKHWSTTLLSVLQIISLYFCCCA